MSDSTPKSMGLSRRRFLTACAPVIGGAAAGLTLLTADHKTASAAPRFDADAVPAILIDVSRCEGCGNCQRACAAANNLPGDSAETKLERGYLHDRRRLPGGRAGATASSRRRACNASIPRARRPARWLRSTRTRTASWSPTPPSASAAAIASTPARSACRVSSGTTRSASCANARDASNDWPRGRHKRAWPAVPRARSRRDRAASFCRRRTPVSKPPLISMLAPSTARRRRAESAGCTSATCPSIRSGSPLDSAPVPHYAESVVTRTPAIALSVAALSTVTYAFMKRRERSDGRRRDRDRGGMNEQSRSFDAARNARNPAA